MRRVFMVVCLFAIAVTAFPVHAQSSLLTVSYLGGGVCNANSVSIPVQITTNFPAPAPFTQFYSVNGSAVGGTSGTQGAGLLTYTGNLGFAFSPQTFPYTYQTIVTFPQISLKLTAVCNANGAEPIVTIGDGAGSAFWDPGDDRLNRDPGQPAALYCRNGGDIHVWRVDALTSRGFLALIVTKDEIAKVRNSHPATNTLIKASTDGKFKLYFLPASDEMSFITTYLNSDKPYYFVWKECA